MKARVQWIGERTFVGSTESGHSVVLGTAHGEDGKKPGPSAMELVLIGAGSCSAWDVVNILEKGREAIALYKEARDHCEKVKDFVSKNLFEELIADEEGHTDYLETQLDLLNRIGNENWCQLNALPTDEVK